MKKIRLGSGTGYARDRFTHAQEMIDRGNVNYICFETMSEVTMSASKSANYGKTDAVLYDPYLERRLKPILKECMEKNIKIISNQGWMDPVGAAKKMVEVAQELGVKCKIAAVYNGNDVLEYITDEELKAVPVYNYELKRENIISAEVYFGADGIKKALEDGAHVVLTTRVVDSALYLGPLAYEFGWDLNDIDKAAKGSIIGHIMECGVQPTGGAYGDPGYKPVPDPSRIGMPIAEVTEDSVYISKVPDTGGLVTVDSVIEQIIYETTDPTSYKLPNVIADLTGLKITQAGKDVVKVEGFKGHPRPETLKVMIGFMEGYMNEEWVGWAGPGAKQRADMGMKILMERLEIVGFKPNEFRWDYVGLNSMMRELTPDFVYRTEPWEVVVRLVCKDHRVDMCNKLTEEIDGMGIAGPMCTAKIGTLSGRLRPVIGLTSMLIDRKHCIETVACFES